MVAWRKYSLWVYLMAGMLGLGFTKKLAAGFDNPEGSARIQALSGSGLAGVAEPSQLERHPASMYLLDSWSVQFNHSDLFQMKELAKNSLFLAHRWGDWSLGAGWTRFGFHVYNEQSIMLAGSRKFHENLIVGLTGLYQHLNIDGGEKLIMNRTAWSVNGSVHYRLTSRLSCALSIQNLFAARLHNRSERLPVIVQTGLCFNVAKGIHAMADWYKDLDFPASLRAGIAIPVWQILELHGGMATNPEITSGGVSLNWRAISFDYAYQHHPVLPATSFYSLRFRF